MTIMQGADVRGEFPEVGDPSQPGNGPQGTEGLQRGPPGCRADRSCSGEEHGAEEQATDAGRSRRTAEPHRASVAASKADPRLDRGADGGDQDTRHVLVAGGAHQQKSKQGGPVAAAREPSEHVRYSSGGTDGGLEREPGSGGRDSAQVEGLRKRGGEGPDPATFKASALDFFSLDVRLLQTRVPVEGRSPLPPGAFTNAVDFSARLTCSCLVDAGVAPECLAFCSLPRWLCIPHQIAGVRLVSAWKGRFRTSIHVA